MRLRLASALSAIAMAAPIAADASPEPNEIVLTGSRTGYAWLTVRQTARYDVDAATAAYGDGRWAGFALGEDAATVWSAYQVYPAASKRPMVPGRSRTHGVLKAGRYKLRLFADGRPVTIRIPWSGPDVTLTADRPVSATIQADRVTVPGPETPVAITFPLDGRVGATTGLHLHLDAAVSPSFTLQACFVRKPDTCEKAWWRVSQPGSGTAVNAFGTGLTFHRWREPMKGLYGRGQITGSAAGLLTVLSLRYDL